MVEAAPLDPCACEMTAQRGNKPRLTAVDARAAEEEPALRVVRGAVEPAAGGVLLHPPVLLLPRCVVHERRLPQEVECSTYAELVAVGAAVGRGNVSLR